MPDVSKPSAERAGRGLLAAACAGVALCLTAVAASGQGNIDCGEAYKKAWESLRPEDYAKLSPDQLVRLTRKALRIYDACQTGDVHDVKALFKRLEPPFR